MNKKILSTLALAAAATLLPAYATEHKTLLEIASESGAQVTSIPGAFVAITPAAIVPASAVVAAAHTSLKALDASCNPVPTPPSSSIPSCDAYEMMKPAVKVFMDYKVQLSDFLKPHVDAVKGFVANGVRVAQAEFESAKPHIDSFKEFAMSGVRAGQAEFHAVTQGVTTDLKELQSVVAKTLGTLQEKMTAAIPAKTAPAASATVTVSGYLETLKNQAQQAAEKNIPTSVTTFVAEHSTALIAGAVVTAAVVGIYGAYRFYYRSAKPAPSAD